MLKMKKYNDRHLRKISHAITIAYLLFAILWGISAYSFYTDRKELKEDYSQGEISREEFLKQSMDFSEKEEKVFKSLFIGFSSVTAGDIAFAFLTKDKEF